MPMKKKLARHGNSRSLVIEKPILDLLQIDDNTMLELTTDGTSLIFTPINDGDSNKKFTSSLKAVMERNKETLERAPEH